MKHFLFPALALLMTACGGGGGSSAPAPAAPAITIAGVVPTSAIIGAPTTFEVSGSNLPAGMRFTLAGCDSAVEATGGSATKRQFTCTPVGTVTRFKGQVSAGSAGATSNPFDFAVDYRAPVLAAVASGWRMAVIMADGTLWSWGFGSGDGTDQPALAPKKIGTGFVDVNAGLGATLAIKQDGSLWSWGGGELLGSASEYRALSPIQIGSGFKKVSVEWRNTTSGEHAIGLKADGTLWVWGARGMPTGQYGMQRTPRMFASGFSDLGANDTALKSDGSVWSWYVNTSVVLPTDPPDNSYTPVQMASGYTALAGGFGVTFGLRADGTLWNWGGYAIRPAGTDADPSKHFLVGSGVRSIATAPGKPLLIKSDNTLWTAGAERPLMPGEFISVWPGDSCSMALKTDGTLWAWGVCYYGDGDYARYNKPGTAAEQVILPK